MITKVLQKEQEKFKRKKWKKAVILTYVAKILVTSLSIAFLLSKLQDDTKELKDYVKNSEN